MHASPAATAFDCPAFVPPPLAPAPCPRTADRRAILALIADAAELRPHHVRHCRDFYARRAVTARGDAEAELAVARARLYHLLATDGSNQWGYQPLATNGADRW